MTVVRNLEARISADGVGGFASEMDRARGSLIDFKTAVGGVGLALAGLSAGGFAVAINEARKFQDSMVELEKVTDPETARKMSAAIKEMAETIPLAQTALADIAADAGRFGVRGPKNIQSFTEAVAKMATATDLNATQAGEALAKLAQLTGTPIPKVENLGSAINELSNNFATSSSEIVDAMLRSSAAMSQFGLSQTEIAGFSAALNEVSESAERAGTRLRRLVQEIMNPKKVADLAAALGMNVSQFKQMQKNSPAKLLTMMAQRMKEGGKSADILNTTLSTTSRQALAGLGQNLDGLNQALGMSAKAFRENTSLQKEFEKASQTFNAQLQLLINRLRNVAISIGNVLLPPLTALVSKIGEAVSWFADLNARLDGMLGPMTLVSGLVVGLTAAWVAFSGTAAAATLATIATALGAVMVPLVALTAATTALAVAWKRDIGGIRTTTVAVFGQVSSRIQSFVGTVRARWTTFTAALRQNWALFGGRITQDANRFIGLLHEAFLRGLTLLKAIFNGNTAVIIDAWDNMLWHLKSAAATGIAAVRDAVVYGLTALIFSFKQTFGQFPTTAALAFQDLLNVVFSGLQSIVEEFLGFRSDSRESWKITMAAWENLTKTHVPRLTTVIQGELGTIRETITGFKNRVITIWKGIWPLLPQPVRDTITRIQELWAAFAGPIVKAAGKLGSQLQNKLGGAFDGIKKAAQDAFTRLKSMWTPIQQALATAWGAIKTPLTNFAKKLGYLDEKGRVTEDGMAQLGLTLVGLTGPVGTAIGLAGKLGIAFKNNLFGIRDASKQAWKQFRDVGLQAFNAVKNWWTTNGPGIIQTVREIWNSVKRITQTILGTLPGIARGVGDAIGRFWEASGSKWIGTFRRTFNTLKKVFNGFATIVTDIVTQLIIPMIKRATTFWKQHGKDVALIIGTLATVISETIRIALDTVLAIISTTTDIIMGIWNTWGDELLTVARFVFDAIASTIGTAIDGIATLIRATMAAINGDWGKAWNLVAGLVERVLGGLYDFITRWGGGLLDYIASLIQDIVRWFAGLPADLGRLVGDFTQVGVDFIQAVIDGIASMGSDLASKAAQVAENAVNDLINTFNRILPDQLRVPRITIGGGSIDLPSAEVAGHTIGGGSLSIPSLSLGGQVLNIPQLQTGGFIEESGLAMLHQDEIVIPAADVDRTIQLPTPGDSDGGDTVTNNTINIDVTVPENADPDTTARSIADELRSRSFN